ncbi:hypothetical protein Rsub_04318 [Raphidocelis subcapitata]|uniref:ABC transporter domain-containing protein n=1 Tax=Raphidocelis subcapitata TaxID=307507 RepID=A0A2V0NVA8_9CHLO|nr:hypothetical protein Rsub_04318 [Raphidocelis subcapitata]|eukprot:GBF91578.1 hypothetical protein Rsub_04318 [Raphidocelis subcapitata]
MSSINQIEAADKALAAQAATAAAQAAAAAAKAAATAQRAVAAVAPLGPAMLDARQRVALWVPSLVFGILYALFFLGLALTTLNPKAWSDVKAAVLGRKRRLRRPSADDECGAAEGCGGRAKTAALANGGAGHAAANGASGGEVRLTQIHRPVVLTWEGLGCAYNSPAGLVPVLQDVCGEARPGEMVALMGPSGSGKSTLLDMLAARKTLGRLTGSVLVNGKPRGPGFRHISSYVPQDDNLTPQMNVVETCQLYSALTLPAGTSPAAAAARMDEVLAAMGMGHARDRLVGGVLPGGLLLRGLSGGERKRLWVAVGILATPSVVFLDEPTTGLDSAAAVAVVNLLHRTVVDSGLTIISSIHQPCSAVWAAYDEVSLLARGRLLYFGPCAEMGSWFEGGLGLGPWNPAKHGILSDWALDLVSIEFTKPEGMGRSIEGPEELRAAARAFSRHYRAKRLAAPPAAAANGARKGKAAAPNGRARAGGDASDGAAPHDADSDGSAGSGRAVRSAAGGGDPELGGGRGWDEISKAAKYEAGGGEDEETDWAAAQPAPDWTAGIKEGADESDSLQRASWMTQFRTLVWRELLSMMRNPVDVAGRMLCFVLLACFMGLVFWNLDLGADGTRNRVNALFLHTMFLLLMPFVYLSMYANDRRVCVADFSARLYSVSAYYAAKQAAVLPFVSANVIISNLVVIGMVGLNTQPSAVFVLCAVSIVFYLLAQQVQSFASIVTPNQEAAFILTIAYTSINLLMSNFIMRFRDMAQHWVSGLRWLSAANYAFSALLANQFRGTAVSCRQGLNPELVGFLESLMPNARLLRTSAVQSMLLRPGDDCVLNLNAVLDYFGTTRPLWVYSLALVCYLLGVHALTFWGLLRLARKERR